MFNGQDLRSLREKKGLTQDAVSMRAGISPRTLSRLEAGLAVPSLETLIKLSNSMEISLLQLFYQVGIVRKRAD